MRIALPYMTLEIADRVTICASDDVFTRELGQHRRRHGKVEIPGELVPLLLGGGETDVDSHRAMLRRLYRAMLWEPRRARVAHEARRPMRRPNRACRRAPRSRSAGGGNRSADDDGGGSDPPLSVPIDVEAERGARDSYVDVALPPDARPPGGIDELTREVRRGVGELARLANAVEELIHRQQSNARLDGTDVPSREETGKEGDKCRDGNEELVSSAPIGMPTEDAGESSCVMKKAERLMNRVRQKRRERSS